MIAKTRMDAFGSSALAAVRRQIGRRTLLMAGGHPRGCLGETAKSAIQEGCRFILVRDGTFDCSILRWPKGIAEVPCALVLNTEELLTARAFCTCPVKCIAGRARDRREESGETRRKGSVRRGGASGRAAVRPAGERGGPRCG